MFWDEWVKGFARWEQLWVGYARRRRNGIEIRRVLFLAKRAGVYAPECEKVFGRTYTKVVKAIPEGMKRRLPTCRVFRQTTLYGGANPGGLHRSVL
jgi:hypothetical protein